MIGIANKQRHRFKSIQIKHDYRAKNSKAKIIQIIDWENICTKYVSQEQIANIIKLLIQIYSKKYQDSNRL